MQSKSASDFCPVSKTDSEENYFATSVSIVKCYIQKHLLSGGIFIAVPCPNEYVSVSGGIFVTIPCLNEYVAAAGESGQDSSRTQAGSHLDPSRTQVGPKQDPSSSLVAELISKMPSGYCSVSQLMEVCGKKSRKKFRENYILPALQDEMLERKYPDTPNHPHQQYRLTEQAMGWKDRH